MQSRKVLYEDFDFIYTKSNRKESENLTWQELEFNRDKKEYVDKDQAKSYFQSEVNFIQAITSKKLHICFSVSVTLKMRYWVRMDDGYPAYWQSYEDDNGYWIENDHPAQEYGFTLFESLHDFDGYISPVKYKNFLKELLKDSEDKILLEKVFLVELFNDNRKAKLYEGKQYFIDSKESLMTDVKISDAMFLKSELEFIQNKTVNKHNSLLIEENNDVPLSEDLSLNIVEVKESGERENNLIIENTKIREYLLSLRNEDTYDPNTVLSKFYRIVSQILIDLKYDLRTLPKRGTREQVKKHLKKEYYEFYVELNIKNSPPEDDYTYNGYWSRLRKDINNAKLLIKSNA